jgi:hypothetical protein
MTLFIFSDMPTFTVVLSLKQLSLHAAVKPFFCPIARVGMSLLILTKLSMHCMGMHYIAMHDVAMHDVDLHDVVMHDMAMHSTGVYCVSMHSMDVSGGKKPIIGAHLRKKRQFFPIICR